MTSPTRTGAGPTLRPMNSREESSYRPGSIQDDRRVRVRGRREDDRLLTDLGRELLEMHETIDGLNDRVAAQLGRMERQLDERDETIAKLRAERDLALVGVG